MARLGDVCKKATSNLAQKDLNGHDGEYPVYGASGFITNVDFYQQENPYIAVVKDGAGVGRVMKLPAKSSVIGTMQYIIPNGDIDISYLAYAMEHMNLSKYYTGATIPHIYFKDYQKEEFPLPNLAEQRKIAAVLDKVSDLIAKRQAQLDKLDLLVKARFVEMFGDPVRNDRRWATDTLDSLCDGIGDGLHGTPEYNENGEYPFINGNNLVNGRIAITPATKRINEEEYKRIYVEIGMNAVLISINGTLGKLALYHGEKVALGKSACYCNLRPEINRTFICGIMQSGAFADFLESSSTKSTIKNVGLKAMREFKVILPPLDMQNQYSLFVEKVDKIKKVINRSLEDLETMKKALMQEYFG